MQKLQALADVLWPFVPPSIVGALFGDTLRKDALSRGQRVAAFAVSAVLGCLAGPGLAAEYRLSVYTGAAFAVVIAAIGTDLIGLAVAVIRQFRDDPVGTVIRIKDALLAFLPSRKP
jgi:hypothetical protein